ncbi:MAG TPA: allantoinase AllB [Drouetiella sp.]|jgi:allantoinase
MAATFGISSQRILTDSGIKSGCLIVEDGRICRVVDGDIPQSMDIYDVGNSVVMPGLIDSHVHVNEPGRTEWEGFETATRAAAAGGITTIADMPLNSNPVTTSLPALHEKLAAAGGKLSVDCAFYGGVVPGNTVSLEPLIDAGVRGFKCFLIHSGIDDFPNVTESDLDASMPVLARRKIPLLVHAELECEDSHPDDWSDRPSSYHAFLHSRPRRWENDAIDLIIKLGKQHNCPVHIVHLSSSDAIPAIEKAKAAGVKLTIETCPHYLTFAAEDIVDGDPRFKCAPPIRERENREKLWEALKKGTIDFVVSDHSPCSPSLKFLDEGNLQKAWGGISGLQFVLPTVWTQAKQRGVSIEQLSKWVSQGSARFLGLHESKGHLKPGYDADIVVWNPEAVTKIDSSIIQHRHKVTPYDGMELFGKVEKTFVRGQLVYDNGNFAAKLVGQFLLKERVESKK